MPVEGIDFAWTKPTADQAKSVGAHWAAGYYSTDPTKNLTHSLVAAYMAAGLPVVGVWETTTTRATQGHQAGVDDAHAALAQQAAVGIPPGTVIHFAVDEDTSWASVASYFAGAASVLGQALVGVYGGLHVIEGAAAAGYRFLWQTVAWSGGQWSAHATIRQEGGTLFAGSSDIDYAEAVDFGQYPHPSEVDLTPAESQMLADIHAALAEMSWGYRNASEDAASEAATKTHSQDAWGKLSSVRSDVADLKAAVADLKATVAKISVGGLDANALAAAVVADEAKLLGAAVPPAKP